MSKDQKSMGRRNVIRRVPRATGPLPLHFAAALHYESLSTATKVAFVHPPRRCNSSMRKPSDNVWILAKNSLLLKGYWPRFIELHFHQ